MVKLQDPQLAKRYGIKTFPALVYFRNGNPLTYEGLRLKQCIFLFSLPLSYIDPKSNLVGDAFEINPLC